MQHCSLERETLNGGVRKDSGEGGIWRRVRSFGILIRAWRFHGRRRVRQRSSRVDVRFLLAVASLHRVRHRSSRVAVAYLRLLGAAAAIYFSRLSVFFEAGRKLFLIGLAVPEGRLAVTTTTQSDPRTLS
jgi:hypothetical protein